MWTLILLALVQGATEFLPVSSSGHLILVAELIGSDQVDVGLELWLHMATLMSLLIYFRQDLRVLAIGVFSSSAPLGLSSPPLNLKDGVDPRQSRYWLSLILLTTFITGIIGLLGRNFFVASFHDPRITWLGFLITGTLLILTGFKSRGGRVSLTWQDAVFVGLAQAVALFPGISRSGLTVMCLLFLGLTPEITFRYAFLILIPLVICATLVEVAQGFFQTHALWPSLISFVVACVTGLLGLRVVKFILILHRLHWFGIYCIFLSLVGWFLIGGAD